MSGLRKESQTDGGKQYDILDGFCLLENTGSAFPEDVLQANMADLNLRKVEPQDLMYFTELLFIDISENSLHLSPFGALPKLRELKIACNEIVNIEDNMAGFNNLLYLGIHTIHYYKHYTYYTHYTH